MFEDLREMELEAIRLEEENREREEALRRSEALVPKCVVFGKVWFRMPFLLKVRNLFKKRDAKVDLKADAGSDGELDKNGDADPSQSDGDKKRKKRSKRRQRKGSQSSVKLEGIREEDDESDGNTSNDDEGQPKARRKSEGDVSQATSGTSASDGDAEDSRRRSSSFDGSAGDESGRNESSGVESDDDEEEKADLDGDRNNTSTAANTSSNAKIGRTTLNLEPIVSAPNGSSAGRRSSRVVILDQPQVIPPDKNADAAAEATDRRRGESAEASLDNALGTGSITSQRDMMSDITEVKTGRDSYASNLDNRQSNAASKITESDNGDEPSKQARKKSVSSGTSSNKANSTSTGKKSSLKKMGARSSTPKRRKRRFSLSEELKSLIARLSHIREERRLRSLATRVVVRLPRDDDDEDYGVYTYMHIYAYMVVNVSWQLQLSRIADVSKCIIQ
jgi:hypothetical protein